jgi:hypothetical protein
MDWEGGTMSNQIPEEPSDQRPDSGSAGAVNPKRRNWRFFAFGFIGWYLVNGVIWVLPGNNEFNLLLTLPANILILIILAIIKRTRWIAFGMLTAIALNFLISLVLGLFNQAVCLVPFFSPK